MNDTSRGSLGLEPTVMHDLAVTDMPCDSKKTTAAASRVIEAGHASRELIPICAWCNSVRTDAGAWDTLETRLRDGTEADLTHGICPSCAATGFGLEEPVSSATD